MWCTCHTNLLYTCHTIHLQSSETYYYKVHVLRKLSMKNQGNGNYKEVLKYDIENSLKNWYASFVFVFVMHVHPKTWHKIKL